MKVKPHRLFDQLLKGNEGIETDVWPVMGKYTHTHIHTSTHRYTHTHTRTHTHAHTRAHTHCMHISGKTCLTSGMP